MMSKKAPFYKDVFTFFHVCCIPRALLIQADSELAGYNPLSLKVCRRRLPLSLAPI
jgi:hypothetical protein